MEEGARSPREEAGEPQESGGGEAEPGGGRRALLLPPGDPPPPAPHPHPHPHRITNFFIDNILRPEFGRRKEAGGLGGESRRPGAENRRSPAAAPTPGAPLPGSGGGSPGRGEGGPPGLALHGASKKGGDPAALEAALKARGLSGGDLSVSSDSDSSQASSNAGNQPMLWPAWVYCTRYSDRPSSGKSCPLSTPTPPRAPPAAPRPPQGRERGRKIPPQKPFPVLPSPLLPPGSSPSFVGARVPKRGGRKEGTEGRGSTHHRPPARSRGRPAAGMCRSGALPPLSCQIYQKREKKSALGSADVLRDPHALCFGEGWGAAPRSLPPGRPRLL
uniref:Engrailed homeobox 2 n=1 Tax=Cairina moschata TaxID=8855 RepID=A0A8C3BE89_CAIMO